MKILIKQINSRFFLSPLLLCCLFLFQACTEEKDDYSLIEKKWKQYETSINGQILMGEDNPQNLIYNFMKDGRCEVVLSNGPQSGVFEILNHQTLQIQAGPANEMFTIDKLTESELNLLDRNGTLLKFKPLQ